MYKNIVIINTGGTFSKTYNANKSSLEIKDNNKFINRILNSLYKSNKKPKVHGIIYKDSLDINKKNRIELKNLIQTYKEEKIIIIHGTDTMNKTAKFLNKKIKNKTIVFVGSMIPYSINKIEALATLSMALGFMNNTNNKDIYICMNGLIKKHTQIKKNYKKIVFEEI